MKAEVENLSTEESALLSVDEEESAAALLRQLDLEETQLDALHADLRQSLTPQSAPFKVRRFEKNETYD